MRKRSDFLNLKICCLSPTGATTQRQKDLLTTRQQLNPRTTFRAPLASSLAARERTLPYHVRFPRFNRAASPFANRLEGRTKHRTQREQHVVTEIAPSVLYETRFVQIDPELCFRALPSQLMRICRQKREHCSSITWNPLWTGAFGDERVLLSFWWRRLSVLTLFLAFRTYDGCVFRVVREALSFEEFRDGIVDLQRHS